MSRFKNVFGNKSISDIRFNDITDLLTRQEAENEFLEYKKDFPSRLDIQKEILAFANTMGGYLIIGIETDKVRNVPINIVGVDKVPGLVDRVISIVRDNSEPPFVPRAVSIDTPNNKCILIVFAHESDTVHRASDGRYYYRTFSQAIPITLEFVSKIIGREKIANEINEIMKDLNWGIRDPGEKDAWIGFVACPIPPSGLAVPLFSDEKFQEWFVKHGVDTLGALGFGIFNDRPFQHSIRVFVSHPKISGGPERAIIELYDNGVLVFGRKLYYHETRPAFYEENIREALNSVLGCLVDVLSHENVGFLGGLKIVISLNKIRGWHWGPESPFRSEDYLFELDHMIVNRESTVETLRADLNPLVTSILSEIKRAFGVL